MLDMTFQLCYCCDWEVLAGAWGHLVLRCTGNHCSLQGAQVQPHLPVVRAGHPKNSFFGWLTGLWHSPAAL